MTVNESEMLKKIIIILRYCIGGTKTVSLQPIR